MAGGDFSIPVEAAYKITLKLSFGYCNQINVPINYACGILCE